MATLFKSSIPVALRAANGFNFCKTGSTLNGSSMAVMIQSRGKSSNLTDAKTQQAASRQYESIEGRTVQFSSSRTRDHSGEAISIQEADKEGASTVEDEEIKFDGDEHLETYDSHGNISLNSVMQSMVPEPYSTQGKRAPTHLNMPGGHVQQGERFLSDHLQNTHYSKNRRDFHTSAVSYSGTAHLNDCVNGTSSHCSITYAGLVHRAPLLTGLPTNISPACALACRLFASDSKSSQPQTVTAEIPPADKIQLSAKDKLKRAVKDYGATVIVFHVGIALTSLGGFYLAVSSGLDVVGILQSLGVGEKLAESRLATGASTFVVAYAVHKVFAPVRIGITLTATPFIVRYLRKVGFLKPPKTS